MTGSIFNEDDRREIEARGITEESVLSQIEIFKKGFSFSKLLKPCTIGDGILCLKKSDLDRLGSIFSQAARSGRVMKFVPASGAASRMFKLLLSFNSRYEQIDEKDILSKAEEDDPEHRLFLKYIRGLKRFAFFDDLKSVMSEDGLDIDALISDGQYKDIVEYQLTFRGLNLTHLPKGLIAFHHYTDHTRTPFAEHLVEAAHYVKDSKGVIRVHFTISPEHEGVIKEHIMSIRGQYETPGTRYEIGYSFQKPSTDTIGVDMENRPFRDRNGNLLFRPGGHGALLENLWELNGDIVFIKNIDNVVPDRLKQETFIYKRALGGYLMELQDEIFGYLKRLLNRDTDHELIKQAFEFCKQRLYIAPNKRIVRGSLDEKIDYLISRLDRPIRVCGMVKNVNEPGGGPFWVEQKDKNVSLQIVESSQVDLSSIDQKAIWESSTHFNPVDLVCGVRDYQGRPFNLVNYVDPDSGFISIKSKDGKELKALELPGLWNGSMANWNTVFIEVPIITFNPVKTVLDLLRKEHQPA